MSNEPCPHCGRRDPAKVSAVNIVTYPNVSAEKVVTAINRWWGQRFER